MQLKRPLCVAVLLLCTGLFLVQLTGQKMAEALPKEKEQISLGGRLMQKEEKNGHLLLYLQQVQILSGAVAADASNTNNKNSNRKMGAVCYLQEGSLVQAPSLGSRVVVCGRVMYFAHAENEGQFDARAYYASLGYDFQLTNAELLKASREADRLAEELFRLREDAKAFFKAYMREENAGILSAMVLGEKSALDSDIRMLFQRNGIAHILAISGLHISLLGMGFYRLLRKCFLPIWVCCGAGVGMLILYGKMVGVGSSVFRACGMCMILLFAQLLGRSYDLLTAMAVTALLLVLQKPDSVQQAGFLLSYGAVLGLTLFLPVFQTETEYRIQKILQEKLLPGIGILLVTLPVQLWFFYELPVYAMLLNLLVIPLMSVLLPVAIFAYLLRFPLLLQIPEYILTFYRWLCIKAEGLPGSIQIFGRPRIWQMIVYYLLLFFSLVLLYHSKNRNKQEKQREKQQENRECQITGENAEQDRRKTGKNGKNRIRKNKRDSKRTGIILIIVSICLLILPSYTENRITMLSIGQGDCILLQEKGGHVFLVDGGSSDVKEAGKYRLIPYLKYHGIRYIDGIFISHAHEDHYSASLELLQSSCGISVGTVFFSEMAEENEAYDVLRKAAYRSGSRITYIRQRDRIRAGDLSLFCLYPSGKLTVTDENEASMVLYATLRGYTMLLTGDSTETCDAAVVQAMKQNGMREVDCLKVAHHGAKTSSSASLLTYISPKLALISCGRDNSYGHPHRETLDRLADCGSQVVRTDEAGEIAVQIRKKKVQLSIFPEYCYTEYNCTAP